MIAPEFVTVRLLKTVRVSAAVQLNWIVPVSVTAAITPAQCADVVPEAKHVMHPVPAVRRDMRLTAVIRFVFPTGI